MYKLYITLLIILLNINISFSAWRAYNCATDNGGNGWDGCNCNGRICTSCNKPNYKYAVVSYMPDWNHCCHELCSFCYDETDGTKCSSCIDGYYLNYDDLSCLPCPPECITCTKPLNGTVVECIKCNLNTDRKALDYQRGMVA